MHVTPRMAVFTVVATLAYLGLAALGEGGLGPFLVPSAPGRAGASSPWRSPCRRCSPAAI